MRAARVHVLHLEQARAALKTFNINKIADFRLETLYLKKSILARDAPWLYGAKKGDSGRFKRFRGYVCATQV